MEQIKCNKCGAIDNFYTELKANNNVARCGVCDAFIKNIPYSTEKVFYFGKYKGKKVTDVEDVNYLEWILANTKQSKPMTDAIIKQVDTIKHLAL